MADENVAKVGSVGFGDEFDTDRKFELIDDGDYEVVIAKVEPKESISSKTGKAVKRLALTFKIRTDVDQKFKGRSVFFTIFGREGDEYYDYRIVNKIIMTQLKKGEKLFLEGVDEVLQYLQDLKLVVGITSEYDDFRDEDRNVIVEDSFKPSVAGPEKKDTSANLDSLEVKDDDLPWLQ